MNLKSNKAITLVALIITIIILLILAGVTLSMVLGDNGLINKAQSSVNAYQEESKKEQNLLENIENFVGEHITKSLGADLAAPPELIVDTPSGWDSSKVTAVTDWKGNTIPVPKKFYYVGGSFDNGVIISDNVADKYNGTDKTSWSSAQSLVGNQFVWIPCNMTEYVKTTWGKSEFNSFNVNDQTTDETRQITTYGGFYVARYEAGLASNMNETSESTCNTTGTPVSKVGAIPWSFISQTNSKTNAESMYNTTAVKSGLITGTQRDVMLNKIIEKTNKTRVDIETDSGSWGNYKNNDISFIGQSGIYTPTKLTWSTKTTSTTGINTSILFTTGASSATEAYHTYDVAGNIWEWTTEIGSNVNNCVVRGGSCFYDSGTCSACYRVGSNTASSVHGDVGFRVVLYIQ